MKGVSHDVTLQWGRALQEGAVTTLEALFCAIQLEEKFFFFFFCKRLRTVLVAAKRILEFMLAVT